MPVFWMDDSDAEKAQSMDWEGTLFITEHNVNKKIPCRSDCLYLSHYVDEGDYAGVPKENILVLKMSQRDFTEEDKDWGKGVQYEELSFGNRWEYHAEVDGYHCLYLYWASDLLPREIDENIALLENDKLEDKIKNEVHFVGHMEEIWVYFMYLLGDRGIPFHKHGASFSVHSHANRSIEENIDLIQTSLIAPALQSDHQVKHRYLPCRIFKNISYGRMGITNNPAVQELFALDGLEVICSRDMNTLIDQAIEVERDVDKSEKKKKIRRLMEYVRDRHTFVNRIRTITQFVEKYSSFSLAIDNL